MDTKQCIWHIKEPTIWNPGILIKQAYRITIGGINVSWQQWDTFTHKVKGKYITLKKRMPREVNGNTTVPLPLLR